MSPILVHREPIGNREMPVCLNPGNAIGNTVTPLAGYGLILHSARQSSLSLAFGPLKNGQPIPGLSHAIRQIS